MGYLIWTVEKYPTMEPILQRLSKELIIWDQVCFCSAFKLNHGLSQTTLWECITSGLWSAIRVDGFFWSICFCLDPILGNYCWAFWPQALTNSWIVAIFTRIARCLPATASGYLFIMSMVPVLARLPDRANRKSDSPLNMGRIRVKETIKL